MSHEIQWREGVWPRDRFKFYSVDGDWRAELYLRKKGTWIIKIRRDYAMVDFMEIDMDISMVKEKAGDFLESCKLLDKKPMHR
jgi:hypothetical protein